MSMRSEVKFKCEPKSSDDEYELVRVPITRARLASHDSKADETPACDEKKLKQDVMAPILRQAMMSGIKGLPRFSTRMAYGGVVTAGASGKFLQNLNGSAAWQIANLSSAAEFTSLNGIFDEVYIEKAVFFYKPQNRYSEIPSLAAAVGNLTNCLVVVAALQHNQALYNDTSSVYYAAAAAIPHKVVGTGDPWTFTWPNNHTLNWKEDVGDSSTAFNSTGWMNATDVSTKYGGFIQMACPKSAGAAASTTNFLANAPLGDIVVIFHTHWRARS